MRSLPTENETFFWPMRNTFSFSWIGSKSTEQRWPAATKPALFIQLTLEGGVLWRAAPVSRRTTGTW
jgi:hypothetical protein